MKPRTTYRRHPEDFKLQVCREIRIGLVGRREAQKRYAISDNLIQQWLTKYGNAPADVPSEPNGPAASYRLRIEALERKIGQMTTAQALPEGESRDADAPAFSARRCLMAIVDGLCAPRGAPARLLRLVHPAFELELDAGRGDLQAVMVRLAWARAAGWRCSVSYDPAAWVEAPDRVAARTWITIERQGEAPRRHQAITLATWREGRLYRLWMRSGPAEREPNAAVWC